MTFIAIFVSPSMNTAQVYKYVHTKCSSCIFVLDKILINWFLFSSTSTTLVRMMME